MKIHLQELRNIVRETINEVLCERTMPVKIPTTPSQKMAFIKLVKWASDKMDVPSEITNSAIRRALDNDWSAAVEIVQDFYVMKGISEDDTQGK